MLLYAFKAVWTIFVVVIPVCVLLLLFIAEVVLGTVDVLNSLIFDTPLWFDRLVMVGLMFFITGAGTFVAPDMKEAIEGLWKARGMGQAVKAFYAGLLAGPTRIHDLSKQP